MKLKKAIEILDLARVEGISCCNDDDKDALKLGIEALKRIQSARGQWTVSPLHLLPGETTE